MKRSATFGSTQQGHNSSRPIIFHAEEEQIRIRYGEMIWGESEWGFVCVCGVVENVASTVFFATDGAQIGRHRHRSGVNAFRQSRYNAPEFHRCGSDVYSGCRECRHKYFWYGYGIAEHHWELHDRSLEEEVRRVVSPRRAGRADLSCGGVGVKDTRYRW